MKAKHQSRHRHLFVFNLFFVALLATVLALMFYFQPFKPTVAELIQQNLNLDDSLTEQERQLITDYITDNQIRIESPVGISASHGSLAQASDVVTEVFLPVTAQKATTLATTTQGLAEVSGVIGDINQHVLSGLAQYLGVNSLPSIETLDDNQIGLIRATSITPQWRLLSLDDGYYLDDFTSGAIARWLEAEADEEVLSLIYPGLSRLDISSSLPSADSVLKINQTGVTALTRGMITKLPDSGASAYASEIGEFLADADITHVSNEVSFTENCNSTSGLLFCSPSEFIEVLKASGVDLVELTGNHNNDFGAAANTATIRSYQDLGWSVVGGGLDLDQARQPFSLDKDGTSLTILAYNVPDAPSGLAVAGVQRPGANPYSASVARADIEAAKASSDYVIVDVQYWECFAYPQGYVEFPTCDQPIGGQQDLFRQLIDWGADMVVGTSAHQPQIFEKYKDGWIYYGLGNLYFDQVFWPGTQRGIVLSHYFNGGELLQTRLTPTIYEEDLITRKMTASETEYFLGRLQ